MENASKALIIAGAILLAISIIGIGMFIFSQASDTIKSTGGLNSEQAATYNSKFDAYMGSNVKGTLVRNLYDTVRNHNISNQSDTSLLVSINNVQTAADLNAAKATILAGATYKVEVTDAGYDSGTGYIKNITVTKVSQ